MANTIRASKNTFSGGLVMDLAPDTTPNTVLTSALNATLVTFNGNEMLLQNDMGNGRVETARLPEGYIPVGTCEFGDIIYIVSYNPLTNKSLIGCFPSPERNISSEEVGSTGLSLSSSDFQVLDNGIPTGKLKTNSVKKIIYNNKLNPGDKFIIYDKGNHILEETHITDIGNTSHTYGSFPKWLKIHVIAIEDSGKINYLDSSIKWYESITNSESTDYFIRTSKKEDPNKPDIDSYRNLLSSGYSVFLSKISGKLALLIELEKITGFSCTHTIYSKNIVNTTSDIEVNKYLTYINFSWETEDPNINPAAIILTEAEWVGELGQLGTVKLWNKSTENDKLIELVENNTDYQSVSYKNKETEYTNITPSYPNNDYYEALLDTLSLGNYNKFISTNSYNAKLIDKLKEINIVKLNGKDNKIDYSKDALIKLNIIKENDTSGYLMLPVEGKYYINALEKIKEKKGENIEINFYSKSSSTGKMFKIEPYEIPDYIVNNYFHYPIYKRFLEFTIPTNLKIKILEGEQDVNGNITKPAIYIDKKPDITNMVYKYTVTPAMPYGLLDEYSITNYIDFSKIGSGSIELNTWKYFVGENALTLTLGLEAYVEDNMGISEIAIEFIDNQGVAAVYHITGKASYSGLFTEVIPLNGAASKSNLNSLNNYRNKWNYKEGICVHCGLQLEEYLEGCVTFKKDAEKIIPVIATPPKNTTPENSTSPGNSAPSGNTTSPENATTNTEEPTYYLNDAGIIYFGMLYLAKITIKYCPVDALGNLDENNISRFKTFNRWLWTTTVFNEYYYLVKDFNDLQLTLTYDIGVKYETNSKYLYKKINYISPKNDVIQKSEDISGYISALVLLITDTSKISNTENSGNNTGNDSGNGSGNNNSGNISEIWEWNVTTYKIYPAISVYYDGEVLWDSTKLHLTTADGTYTYELNIYYKLVEGPKDILIVLTGILKGTKIIVNSEEGFGKAKQSGKVSPPNTLELTVN